MIDVTCKQCGLRKVKRRGRKYCSTDCAAAASRTGRTLTPRVCRHCGIRFGAQQAKVRDGGGKYCSVKCRWAVEGTTFETQCKHCGKSFSTTPRASRAGPAQFCSRKCSSDNKRTGHTGSNGYVKISYGGRQRPEHCWVMEQHLGRPLLPHENVHHINGQRADNRIENLELWSTSQPSGQRVRDKLEWAATFIREYGGSAQVQIPIR